MQKPANRVSADTSEKRSEAVSRAIEKRLVMVRTKLPLSLQRRLQDLAQSSGSSVYQLVRKILEEAIEKPSMAPHESKARRAKPHPTHPLRPPEKVGLFLDPDDVSRVEAYAAKSGLSKATAFAALLRLALEVSDEREGIPGSRVDEMRDVLHLIEAFLARVASTVLGMQVLQAFLVAKTPGIKVSEDEILEQCRLVGEDEWRRVFDEIRHSKADGE